MTHKLLLIVAGAGMILGTRSLTRWEPKPVPVQRCPCYRRTGERITLTTPPGRGMTCTSCHEEKPVPGHGWPPPLP
jgi:hypothetical protein